MMPAHAAIAHRPFVFSASTNLHQHGFAIETAHALPVVLTIVKAQGWGGRGRREGACRMLSYQVWWNKDQSGTTRCKVHDLACAG